jgi:NAD(P)-dependent dehydrogenase (short-subunit alcohol dehydrogenase family)/acyl carrier protein
VQQVRELEALGAEVLVLQADVTDTGQMTAALAQAEARFGRIHGVLHTAGVPGMGLMQLKTAATAAAELAPKVQGTLALTRALAGRTLDFLVLFSSVTSATGGGPGQVAYCAGNAFLDAYARAHVHEHGLTVAVSWGEWLWDAWSAGLAGFPPEVQEQFRAYRKAFGISFEEGAEVLRRILACRIPHVFVTTEDVVGMYEGSKRTSVAAALAEMEQQQAARTRYPRPTVGTSFVEPQNELEQRIAAIWSEVLGIEPIGVNDNFFDLGGNSLLGIGLISQLRKSLKLEKLPAHVLYEAPTIGTLGEYIAQAQQPTAAGADLLPDLEAEAEKRQEQLDFFRNRSQMEELA